jgi:type I restriction enzyme S subunit
MANLPAGWTLLTLNDVGEITTGNTPPTKQKENYGGNIPFVKPGDLDYPLPITKTEQTLSDIGAKYARLLRPGAILVSCIGNLGKIGIAGVPLATNQQINSIEFYPSLVHDRYAYQYCKTLKPWMESEASATTVTILNKGRFSKAPFPLAPLDEQKRIAEKLDTLFARVDSCQTHLERVPQILKRFRQSVLAAATSGRLTEDWRKDEKVIEYGEFVFPAAWELSTFDDALTLIDGDRGPSYPKQSDYQESGHCLFLSTKNVRKFGFEFDDVVFISEEKHKKLRSGTLQYGDVIITTRGTLGNVAYYDETVPYKVIRINSGMLILRKKRDNLLGKYLMICIGSPLFTSELEEKRSGSAQPQIPAKTLKTFALPIPTIEEQAEIVRRVEKLFAYAERLEARYTSASEHVERLTPSLLAKAFRGELVRQE